MIGRDIQLETLRNYFVEKKGDLLTKDRLICKEHQIFNIIPVNANKKIATDLSVGYDHGESMVIDFFIPVYNFAS